MNRVAIGWLFTALLIGLVGCSGGTASQGQGTGGTGKPKSDDEKTVAAFKEMGAEVITDKDGFVTQLNCAQNKKIQDADLARLSGLPRLKTLFLTTTGITDEGLQHLKGLASLKSLGLAETKVTDKGMAELEGLSLESLILFNTAVSDAKVAELQKKFGPLASVVK